MGMPQPGSAETSENAVSEGHDRSQSTSIDSPKAAQPSCLRGGFIRLFLKRAEQDTSPEDASSSNQSTGDKHGVRGKKRKVLGGNIFRLSCLRPAERTDNSEQMNTQVNKVDEQGNQVIPEEELKPYSKASFLRKIRGYRLMRERDATEKEKVIEMEQCKESSVGEELHEQKTELFVKVTEPRRYKNILEEKGKVVEKKENQENVRGGRSSEVQEQERKVELSTDQGIGFREQENKNLRDQEKTVVAKDNCEMDVAVKRKNKAEHKKTVGKVEELGKDLQEHKETVEDAGNKVTKHAEQIVRVPDPENSRKNQEISSQRVYKPEKYVSEHNQLIHAKKAGAGVNDLPGNKLDMEKAEKLTNYLREQESPEENTRDMAKSSPKQDNNEGEVRTKISEQKKDEEMIQVVIDQEGQARIAEDTQKKEETIEESTEKLPKNKSRDENLAVSENSVVDKDSHKENEDYLLELENHAGETENPYHKQNIQAENVGEATNQSVEQGRLIAKEGKAVDQFLEQDHHVRNEGIAGNHLLKQDHHIQKKGKAGDQFLEENCHILEEEKAGNHLLEQDHHIQKEGKAGDHFLEKNCHIQGEGKAGDQLLDEDCHIQEEGKAGDQFLEEGCQIKKGGNADGQFPEEGCHIQEERKTGDQFPEEDCYIQEEGKAGDQFLEQSSRLKKEGKAGAQFPEEDCHIQQEGKEGDQFLDEDCHIQEEGKAGDRFPEEDCHIQEEGEAAAHFPEEDCHIQEEEKAGAHFPEEDCHIQEEGKAGDQFLEQSSHLQKERKAWAHFKEKESNIQKVGDTKSCLLGQNSNMQHKEQRSLEQRRPENNLGITKVQITAQTILTEGEGEDCLLKHNKRVKKHKGQGKVFSEEVKDRSVKQEIPATLTTCTTRSEKHKEFSTFQEQKSAPNTVDFNYYCQDGSQEDISDGDDDNVMEDTDWRSLQVEVKSMVQWLVEEASDRLTCFTDESQGTE